MPITRFFLLSPASYRILLNQDVVLDVAKTFPLYILSKLFHVPKVFAQLHSNQYIDDILNEAKTISRIRSFFVDYVTVILSPNIVAVSGSLKNGLARLYGHATKMSVVENGVDTTMFRRKQYTEGVFDSVCRKHSGTS